MNQYGNQLREQWEMDAPADVAAMDDAMGFFDQEGERAKQQILDLTAHLSGSDLEGETYLQKVGRINNARMRAEEIVMAEMPRAISGDEWETRFDAWQAGHPIWQTLREFEETMDNLDDAQEQTAATSEANQARATVTAELEAAGLPATLIETCLTPREVPSRTTPGQTITLWATTGETDQQIRQSLRTPWKVLSIEVREDAWNAATGGSGYFQATMRMTQGLPR